MKKHPPVSAAHTGAGAVRFPIPRTFVETENPMTTLFLPRTSLLVGSQELLPFHMPRTVAVMACALLILSGGRSPAADRDRIENGDYTKTVAITFSGTTATVADGAGVTVTYGANTSGVSITSTLEGVEYILSGTSAAGYLQLTSTHPAKVTLNGVALTSTDGPALSMISAARNFVTLAKGTTNTLTDSASYTRSGSGALYASGPLIFSGTGTLSVAGVKSHAIYGGSYIRCLGGDITVPAAAKDAIHSKTLFQMDRGTLKLTASGDGIDGDSGAVTLNGGSISIRSAVDDTKGIVCDSALTVNGGTLAVDVLGVQSKALSTKAALTVNGGVMALNLSGSVYLATVTGTTTYVDPSYCTALKATGNVAINAGTISITHTGLAGKGISTDGSVTIGGGTVDIATSGGPSASYTNSTGVTDEATSTCIKADGNITLAGGAVILRTEGIAAGGLSADGTVTLSAGTLDVTVKGARAKGVKADTAVSLTGGTSTFTLSGALVLQATTTSGRYDPSYCTGIKSDATVSISGGTHTITHTGQAGKGISADGAVTITGGTTTISTSGANTATFTNASGVTDMAAADCLKADGNLTITGGTITATSTGNGGDAISSEGAVVIGTLGNDTTPVISANTTGSKVLLTGSGNSADYVNAKAFKAEGNLTMNGGIFRATTTKDGGEGMESKATLTINGGVVEISTYDDCINASTNITVNGGMIYCYSSNNDGIDSNGTFRFTGGTIISSGASAPEEGFDCDNNNFTITGGTLIGTGGATSTPTTSTTTQNVVIYKAAATANVILVLRNSSGTNLVYKLPRTYSSMTMLVSLPSIAQGTQYTIVSGATVTGGTEFHGYYVGATVTGGTTLKTFTPAARVTTVQ